MSHVSTGILAGIAVAVTLGAVQFASGRDLYSALQARGAAEPTSVNRTAKADRAPRLPGQNQTRTISLRLDSLSDTSILIRVPLALEIQNNRTTPGVSGKSKSAVACEPVVSVLTEIARQLQPGRCVT